MSKTQLLYLPEFDVLEDNAEILECAQDGDSLCIALDRTVFYPGGGGQPADTGVLVVDSDVLAVQELWMDDRGVVIHRVEPSTNLAVGTIVHMKVDADSRALHCRLHSAGHVIDLAVNRLGYDWSPTKGAHFPGMSFVEYETDGAKPEDAQGALQAKCDELVAAGSTNIIRFTDAAGAMVDNPSLGHMEVERVVAYDDFSVSCGGTHVADISEIGPIVVRKVKKKKNVVKVSYGLESP